MGSPMVLRYHDSQGSLCFQLTREQLLFASRICLQTFHPDRTGVPSWLHSLRDVTRSQSEVECVFSLVVGKLRVGGDDYISYDRSMSYFQTPTYSYIFTIQFHDTVANIESSHVSFMQVYGYFSLWKKTTTTLPPPFFFGFRAGILNKEIPTMYVIFLTWMIWEPCGCRFVGYIGMHSCHRFFRM